MKKIAIFALLLITATSLQAQKIKFKKGKVLLDDTVCLNYESSATNVELVTLDDNQTIILKFIRTGVGRNGGLFTKVVFVEQKKSFTSKSFIFTKKLLVKKLIADKVLVDCTINPEKIDQFVLKYGEGIEDTLVRY